VKLVITVLQAHKHKPRVITSTISEHLPLSTMRKVFEMEQALNTLPGSDLRWHFNLTEDEEVVQHEG
jgi:hypothetical protein